jgi:hypothetical protein
MGGLIDLLAALCAIGAGVYLLSHGSPDVELGGGGSSWFEIIAHGMGAYFIGKGVYIGRSSWQRQKMLELMERVD